MAYDFSNFSSRPKLTIHLAALCPTVAPPPNQFRVPHPICRTPRCFAYCSGFLDENGSAAVWYLHGTLSDSDANMDVSMVDSSLRSSSSTHGI